MTRTKNLLCIRASFSGELDHIPEFQERAGTEKGYKLKRRLVKGVRSDQIVAAIGALKGRRPTCSDSCTQ